MSAPLELDAIRERKDRGLLRFDAIALLAEVERLRADTVPRSALVAALAELDAEHRPDPELKGRGGCVMCWPHDGSWPCTTRLIADELRVALDREPRTGLVAVGWACKGRLSVTQCCAGAERVWVVGDDRDDDEGATER